MATKISERLRTLRFENKQTCEQAAQAFGIQTATWSGWECQRSRPDIDMVLKIGANYNVSASWLLGETEARTLMPIVNNTASANINHGMSVITQAKSIATNKTTMQDQDDDRIKFLETQLTFATKEKEKLLTLIDRLTQK